MPTSVPKIKKNGTTDRNSEENHRTLRESTGRGLGGGLHGTGSRLAYGANENRTNCNADGLGGSSLQESKGGLLAEHNPSQSNKELIFNFQQNIAVRTIEINGELWIVVKDVMDALNYSKSSNPARTIKHIPEEWRGVNRIHTLGGEQDVSIISEQGLYFFLGRSDKPKALPFQKWFAGDVMPAIRKTGAYIHVPAMRPSLTNKQKREIRDKIDRLVPDWVSNQSYQWIYNHLRIVFQVARVEDIPEDQYDTVVSILDSKRETVDQYIQFLFDMRAWFEREVLGAGTPWTPHIRRMLFKKLGRQVILPPNVDWLALADEASRK